MFLTFWEVSAWFRDSNDMTLVTRNVKDFDYLGVSLFNPFDETGQ